MIKIFDTKYKYRSARALGVINSKKDLTYLQKLCIAKLYLLNNLDTEILISPSYFNISKPAYNKLITALYYQDYAKILGRAVMGVEELTHLIILKELNEE